MNFMVALSLLSFFAVSNAGVSMHNPFYCYATDWIRPQNQMYSLRTSYEAVRRTQIDPTISACIASKFWYLGRHGGRNPEIPILTPMFELAQSSVQADILRNWEDGRGSLCRQDVELIRGWTRNANLSFEVEQRTTVAGWTAMQNIARRYQQAFPQLLPNAYNPANIVLQHSFEIWAHLSMRGFVDGLFGDLAHQTVQFENIPPVDWFLRPQAVCPAFAVATANASRERIAFEAGVEAQQMVREINDRLGFTSMNSLNFQQIFTMWEWCRFEAASQFDTSPSEIGEDSVWCIPFSVAHHAILEYGADLFYHHLGGYGNAETRLQENLQCGLLQDLMNHLRAGHNVNPSAKVFVTGGHTIQLFLVSLGAMRDETRLTHFNFAQQSFRQWKTSFLTPNAGHVSVASYNCADGDHDVQFFINERPLIVPGCQPNGLCKLSFLLRRFDRFLNANCEQFFCTTN